jgi:hypothetical protein
MCLLGLGYALTKCLLSRHDSISIPKSILDFSYCLIYLTGSHNMSISRLILRNFCAFFSLSGSYMDSVLMPGLEQCEKHSKKEQALEKLREGAKFDEVAREFSEDKARQGLPIISFPLYLSPCSCAKQDRQLPSTLQRHCCFIEEWYA